MAKFRVNSSKEIWDRYTYVENELREVKSIIQNDGIIITEKELLAWQDSVRKLLRELRDINKEINDSHIEKI